MRNLAGKDYGENDQVIAVELTEAGVRLLKLPCLLLDEVRARYVGLLDLPHRHFLFQRAWCYWRVTCSPPLPSSEALAIDGRPYSLGDGTSYSGARGVLGDVARADGCAGGPPPISLTVETWHIDTLAGLIVFVRAVRS